MKGLRDIQKKFFLTQQQFAAYLGVSLSLLNMAERGERSLPTAADLKIAWMEIFWDKAKNEISQTVIGEQLAAKIKSKDAFISKTLQADTELCNLRIKILERKLHKMQQSNLNAVMSLHTFNSLVAALPKDRKDEFEGKLLDLQQKYVERKLLQSGPAAQAKLRAKLLLLKAATEINESLAKEFLQAPDSPLQISG